MLTEHEAHFLLIARAIRTPPKYFHLTEGLFPKKGFHCLNSALQIPENRCSMLNAWMVIFPLNAPLSSNGIHALVFLIEKTILHEMLQCFNNCLFTIQQTTTT